MYQIVQSAYLAASAFIQGRVSHATPLHDIHIPARHHPKTSLLPANMRYSPSLPGCSPLSPLYAPCSKRCGHSNGERNFDRDACGRGRFSRERDQLPAQVPILASPLLLPSTGTSSLRSLRLLFVLHPHSAVLPSMLNPWMLNLTKVQQPLACFWFVRAS